MLRLPPRQPGLTGTASPRLHHSRKLTRLSGVLGILCLSLLVTAAKADPVRIELHDAPPAVIARQLQHVLGAPVEIRGGEGKRLTLLLAATSPQRILERIAVQLGGTWRMRLLLRPRRADAPTIAPQIDHGMTLGVQDVPAQRAFALIARELKAELDVQGDLTHRVSIIAANVPANVVLDRVAEQAGVSWDVAYRLDVPNMPAPIAVVPPARETSELPKVVIPPSPPASVVAMPTGPSAASLRAELWAGIKRIVRVAPDQRTAVVQEFLQRGDVVLNGLARLSPGERAERLRVLGTLIGSWRRLYQGLAPRVQTELAPVTALLELLQP